MKDFLAVLESIGLEDIRLLSQTDAVTVKQIISSGIFAIDYASGLGGLPNNRIIEIFGPEASGKTTLALSICAQVNKIGRYAAYIDVENAVDISYARKLGVRDELFALSQPSSAESAGNVMVKCLRAPSCGIVVLDSVAQLATEQELAGDLDDANIGATARFMGRLLRKVPPMASVNETIVLFINQIREKVGVVFGSPIVTPGGRALKFAASIRIDLAKTATNRDKKTNEAISNTTRAKFIKNKLAPPFTEAVFDIQFGKTYGPNNYKSILELAEKKGIVEKKGSRFCFEGQIIANGIDATSEVLKNDYSLYKAIRKAVLKTKPDQSYIEEPTIKRTKGKVYSVTETVSEESHNSVPRVLTI
jgi:recombination protein RecA